MIHRNAPLSSFMGFGMRLGQRPKVYFLHLRAMKFELHQFPDPSHPPINDPSLGSEPDAPLQDPDPAPSPDVPVREPDPAEPNQM